MQEDLEGYYKKDLEELASEIDMLNQGIKVKVSKIDDYCNTIFALAMKHCHLSQEMMQVEVIPPEVEVAPEVSHEPQDEPEGSD